MVPGLGAPDPLTSAQRKADTARASAAHEIGLAERCEVLAQEAPLRQHRELHLRSAAAHRSTAARHLIAAGLLDAYARRLTDWARDQRAPRPLFMTGVAEACGTPSAALALVGEALDQLAVAASDESARAAQELEFLLGEGPALEAARSVRPVSARGPELDRRWGGYGPAVRELGISEVIAVPLGMEDVCVGALTVFDPAPGVAGSTDLTEVADALTHSMILGSGGDPSLYGGMQVHALVHQAAGMVSVQLDCTVADALEMIKARTFAEGVSARSVAERILAGRLRLG
ncbi:GAF and ANTAR domain-containing protein [Streptomyces sp. 7R007]